MERFKLPLQVPYKMRGGKTTTKNVEIVGEAIQLPGQFKTGYILHGDLRGC